MEGEAIVAYVAMSPHGRLIPSTIASTGDLAWQRLREQITEPDTLHDNGWTVAQLRCVKQGASDGG